MEVIAPPSPTNNPSTTTNSPTTHQGRHTVERSKSYFLSHFEIEYMDTTPLPVFTYQFLLISLDNDQLSVILIATITTSDIRSDCDGASIVLIISLPTSRSKARIRPFPT